MTKPHHKHERKKRKEEKEDEEVVDERGGERGKGGRKEAEVATITKKLERQTKLP